jgi:hypothetical protein
MFGLVSLNKGSFRWWIKLAQDLVSSGIYSSGFIAT